MIGRRLTAESGEQWDIVAAEHGQFVIAPVEHGRGPVENVTAAALAARFGVEAEPPAATDEPAAWAAIGRAFRAPPRRADLGPTPEEVFDATPSSAKR